jgi:hypothetical protein
MDVGLAWRRSIAAGVAVELLVHEGRHSAIQDGLLAGAIMHDVGRVVLGTLYPQLYESMIRACRKTRRSLQQQERRFFPDGHTQVAARVLAEWKIPTEVCHPLTFVLDGYDDLASLEEPLRTKVELIKLAILVARIAVGRWDSWDQIALPGSTVLKHLNISSLESIIEQTASDLEQLVSFQAKPRGADSATRGKGDSAAKPPPTAYCNLGTNRCDLLRELLQRAGCEITELGPEELKVCGNALVNCLGADAGELESRFSKDTSAKLVAVTDAENDEDFARFVKTLCLPTSYAALFAVTLELEDKSHSSMCGAAT